MALARKSKGRQKIEMTRMSKESNLLVTFSKRRSGLFKKASELCTLCAAEVAIVVFSPGKKVFSFGHPCVDSVVDRFLTRNPPPPPTTTNSALQLVEAHRNASVRELNAQFTQLLNELEAEKKRGDELSTAWKESRGRWWWEGPIEEMGMEELEQLKVAMEELKMNVAAEAEKLMMINPISPFLQRPRVSPIDAKDSGLGLSMTPHGYTLGRGHGPAFF